MVEEQKLCREWWGSSRGRGATVGGRCGELAAGGMAHCCCWDDECHLEGGNGAEWKTLVGLLCYFKMIQQPKCDLLLHNGIF